MEDTERIELIRETERRVRLEIAQKMREDRLAPEVIQKYTGILPEDFMQPETSYEETAKQVACEMLLRGLPLEMISTATGVSQRVLRELQSQMPE